MSSASRRLVALHSVFLFMAVMLLAAPSFAQQDQSGPNLQVSVPSASGTTFRAGDKIVITATVKNKGYNAPFEARLEIKNPDKSAVIFNSRPRQRFRLIRNGAVTVSYELDAPAAPGTYTYRLRVRNIYSSNWQVRQPAGEAWDNIFEVVSDTVTPPQIDTKLSVAPPDTSAQEMAREKEEREAREKLVRENKEREDREAKAKAERDALEKAERDAKEWEERVIKEREEREVKEREKREAKERADREAFEKSEREARERADRIAKERAEKEARERVERETRERTAREAREKAQREAKAKWDAEEKARLESELKGEARVVERGSIIIILPPRGAALKVTPDRKDTDAISNIRPDSSMKIVDTPPVKRDDRADNGGRTDVFGVEPARLVLSTMNSLEGKITGRSISIKGNFAERDAITLTFDGVSGSEKTRKWTFKVGEEFSMLWSSEDFPFTMAASGNVAITAEGAKITFNLWTVNYIDLQSMDKYDLDATIQGSRPDQKAPIKIIVTPGDEVEAD